jgi:hypothetical protein
MPALLLQQTNFFQTSKYECEYSRKKKLMVRNTNHNSPSKNTSSIVDVTKRGKTKGLPVREKNVLR